MSCPEQGAGKSIFALEERVFVSHVSGYSTSIKFMGKSSALAIVVPEWFALIVVAPFWFVARIVRLIPIQNNPKSSGCAHHMGGTCPPRLSHGISLVMVGELTLSVPNVDALPSEEAGIH